ncbi:MAG: hypothetical protein IKH08_02250 [Prevotella sp.]|nr:hypothetical protein [Prevotella sp.]
MKQFIFNPIVGGILFALGMLMATGVDVNPVQGVYALLLLGAGAVCFSHEDSAKNESEKETKSDTVNKKAA